MKRAIRTHYEVNGFQWLVFALANCHMPTQMKLTITLLEARRIYTIYSTAEWRKVINTKVKHFQAAAMERSLFRVLSPIEKKKINKSEFNGAKFFQQQKLRVDIFDFLLKYQNTTARPWKNISIKLNYSNATNTFSTVTSKINDFFFVLTREGN